MKRKRLVGESSQRRADPRVSGWGDRRNAGTLPCVPERCPDHFKGRNARWSKSRGKKPRRSVRTPRISYGAKGILAPDWRVRLPTEAPLGIRLPGRTTTAYFFGNDAARLGQFAWFDGNSTMKHIRRDTGGKTVGLMRDLARECKEWCETGSVISSLAATNPLGPSSGCRVRRGESLAQLDRGLPVGVPCKGLLSSRFSDLGSVSA